MSFPTYPAYKDSGVKWLSDVPEHWDVRRNKQVFRLVSVQVGNKSADFQLLSLTLRGVIPRDMESGKGKFPAEFDTYQVVEPDDIVFCLFDIDETPRTVGISSDFGMITGAYTVAKTLPAADPRFIYYYYFSIDLRKGLRPFYTGLRKVVRPETFLNIELPLPPLSEQATICNFLDHETARIDALIEEQQRLIELLKEKRQVVISNAVTKGLDPTVPMKDSGVEWLGEVPAHWGVRKFFFGIQKIIDNRGRSPSYVDSGIPILEARQLSDEGMECTSDFTKYISEESHSEFVRDDVVAGDVLMVTVGTIGKVGMVGENPDFVILQNIVGFRVGSDIDPGFMAIYLKSGSAFMAMQATNKESILSSVKVSDFIQHKMPLPPLAEQKAIVYSVNTELSKYGELQKEAELLCSTLHERRSALISAAVTGKIDVRNW